MKKEDTVYNQLVEGTSRITISNVPYTIKEEHNVNFKSLEANVLKWGISEIVTDTTEDHFMSTKKTLQMTSYANISGTLSVTMAIDENFDNFYTLWLWHRMTRRAENRRPGRSPDGKALMINSYCEYVEIPMKDNNLNESMYIVLEQVGIKSMSGFRYGEYSNKSILTEVSFTYNNMEIERVSRGIEI